MEQNLNSNSSGGTAADSYMQPIVIPSADIAVNPLLPAVLSQPTIESYNTGDLLFYTEYNGIDLWTNYANGICVVSEDKDDKFIDTLYYTQDDGKTLKKLKHLDRLTADLQYLNLYRKIGIVSDLQNMSLDDINERYAVK